MLACLIGLGLLLTGCNKADGPQSKAAVQAAIEAHLQLRQNVVLSNMTLEVQDVKFSGETAEAQVNFRSKQAADLVVGVRYVLRRSGDTWKVESSAPTSGMGATPHDGMGTSPHDEGGGATPAPTTDTPAPQSSH
jgi:hypothetical protein